MNLAKLFLTIFSILSFGHLQAQESGDDIMLSGVVLAGDSLRSIPNANIIIKNKNKGTASDQEGYFSFYVNANDTLLFSAVGYKKGSFVVPENWEEAHYSMVQIMTNDTVWLQESIVFPWQSYEDFGEQLITMTPPISDKERAQRNLDDAQLYEKSLQMHMDGSANFKHSVQMYADRMYFAAQAPPLKIFDPFAWAQFVKSIKQGDYQKK